ncbi:hypothetical protein KIW84_052807 [Lathyrus oleraceus]|uniref:Aminotransferase-like plant mobile domain-containing protein n=1 Tax=Pisum sativum TaxID=3888 RepID=A0A9D4WPM4_PEA|nr:hypothetical protein KIW84_052807 [Pisum sativum]
MDIQESRTTRLFGKVRASCGSPFWFDEERGPKKELKVAGHGLKLTLRVPLALPQQVESWVSRSGLSSLQRTSLNKIDTNMISAFVERWHLESSSFHMPFDEMSITFDDVSCLLHLPINGVFWSPQDVIEEAAVELAVDYLGVLHGEAQSHVRSCMGSYYKLEWLYDLFVQHRAASSWAYATRAYLLMLVGSTFFTENTFTLVEARYLLLFTDLDICLGYSWGAVALITLYRYLGDASMGCLKWGDPVVPYLPDRCLRQFGYKQYVPSPPLGCMMATDIDVDWIRYHQSVIAVIRPTTLATTPSDIEDGYLE